MGREFFYTSDENTILTREQRAFYEDNGFLLFKNLIPPDLIEEFRQRFVDICDKKVDHGRMTVMRDPSLKNKGAQGEYLINKLQEFLYDDVLYKYAAHEGILKIVGSIIGQEITGVHSMLINKPPDSDPGASLHPLHQDLHYFPFRPAEKVVASWTAMEHVDEQNGCLYVIPGTHKGALYPHTYPEGYQNKLYHGVQGMDHLRKYNVVMEKGDTLFFHPLLLHGSGPNRTKGFRKAISVHYANSNVHFIDVRGTTQSGIADEVEKQALKQYNLKLTLAEVFKFKGRLIQGPPGNYQKLDSHL